jgi:hypothetical protein
MSPSGKVQPKKYMYLFAAAPGPRTGSAEEEEEGYETDSSAAPEEDAATAAVIAFLVPNDEDGEGFAVAVTHDEQNVRM